MDLTVLGNSGANALLTELGFKVRANVRPRPGDVVLIAISARRGADLEYLRAIHYTAPFVADRLGVLVTDSEPWLGGEALVLLCRVSVSLVLRKALIEGEMDFEPPHFRADDPELRQKLVALGEAEPRPFRFIGLGSRKK
jgi:hypothetical protein